MAPCVFDSQGPRMVRDVFRLAKENAPSIIFIDEVDAIATARFDAQVGLCGVYMHEVGDVNVQGEFIAGPCTCVPLHADVLGRHRGMM